MKWVWVGKYKVWLFNKEGQEIWREVHFRYLYYFPRVKGIQMSLGTEVWLSVCIKIPKIYMSVHGNIYCARKLLYSAQNSCNPQNIY